ncbi:hypothetical protein TVAG_401350 [Trichomonas vaginalis G3]|uniref:Uncharacterized protein n=1 Tax=Trichomonas vaginalis (strain ATCC PRA-98 / G3) TaxID=412133 RepID=A2EGA2_TRIV3|nr:hypothetical protein TVAG_401350 [Trichomonas vaginalis G3]|eukprot:XP_001320504.1 hypothetical protein [Trichomonas vaginalis G3]
MGYLLDFIVNNATFTDELPIPKDPIYAIFQADGLNESIATKPIQPQEKITWNHPVRAVLNLESLSQAHMYAQLCTLQENPPNKPSPYPIGYARIKLKSFPVGTPATFSFPLLNPSNTAITIATMSMTANITAMIPVVDTSSFAMGIPINR